jgi:photosystem II stability/assembly factor-like uncharacterized protein
MSTSSPIRTAAIVALALLLMVSPEVPCSAQWDLQMSGTRARLRGLFAVSGKVAWATGAQGTVLRTNDGGASWRALRVPGGEALDFRDVHAFDETSACILSIGPGELSRIYRTSDAGVTWTMAYRGEDPRVFLDAIAFWDGSHGIAQGDPIDGRFLLLRTDDGGKTWTRSPGTSLPPAMPGEGAFAASGTCLVAHGERNAWFGTGGAKAARVFRSQDRGRSWTVHETPIRGGASTSGIFSLAFRDDDHGIAVGGDYKDIEASRGVVSRTADGGRTWSVADGAGPRGFRSAVAYIPRTATPTLVAGGPTGADLSTDDGATWKPLGTVGFHALGFAGRDAGWGVGEDGRIARFAGRLN